MKKYLISIAFITLIIPSVALASWWNPLSWFDHWTFSSNSNAKTQVLEKRIQELESKLSVSTSTPQYSHFYIKYDNARVRACKSTTCDVLGYYKKNDYVYVLGSEKLDSLDEWVALHTTESGQNGYLNKSVLSETPSSPTNKPLNTPSSVKSSNIKSGNNSVLITIDNQIIGVDKESIEYLKSEVSDVNESINFFTKFRQMMIDMNNNTPKSVVIGDRYEKFISIFIDSLGKDIAYFNAVLSQYINMIDELNKHILVAQENRKLFEFRIYENDRAELNDAAFFLEQSKKDKDLVFKAYDISRDYSHYYQQQTAVYKQALLDFGNLLRSDKASLSIPYIPPTLSQSVTPTIPLIQIPKITHCNISPLGGGGVDLVVTCY